MEKKMIGTIGAIESVNEQEICVSLKGYPYIYFIKPHEVEWWKPTDDEWKTTKHMAIRPGVSIEFDRPHDAVRELKNVKFIGK